MVKERAYTKGEKGRELVCHCTVSKKVENQYGGENFLAGLRCTCSETRVSGKGITHLKRSRPRRYGAVIIRKGH